MSLKVAVLTSRDLRHRFFASAIAARFNVVAVGYQDVGYTPAAVGNHSIDDRTARILKHHFDERRRQEHAYFGHAAEFLTESTDRRIQTLDTRSINAIDTAEWLVGAGVDVVVVYGTSLLKTPLLQRFPQRIINMHLGLSPYYRGTATNFYPLLNEEPEFVGATIHLIDEGIDSGNIIHHVRPTITATDMPHTVGCKAILAGIRKVIQSLAEFQRGTLVTTRQWSQPNARLQLRKDYHPKQVVRLYELIEAGLFPEYVTRKHHVENAFRLVP